MDVRYVNPFIAAVQHVFQTMLETTILISKPALKSKDAPNSDVSAIIGFTGDAVGSVALCFSRQTALRVANRFAGDAVSPDDLAMLADALGELTNMVAGQAKAQLPTGPVNVSLPRVVVGDDHRVVESYTAPVLLLICDSALGRFSVEVTMQTPKVNPFAARDPAKPVVAGTPA